MTFVTVHCPHCDSEQIVKRGKTGRGTQRYLCQNTACITGSFLLDYCNRGCLPEVGRIPAGCGYCFGTSPNPSERGQSAGHHHSKPVFKTPSMSLGLYLSTLSPSTSRSATSILF